VLVLPGGSPVEDIIRKDNRIRDIILEFTKKEKYFVDLL